MAGVRYRVDACLDDECHSEEILVTATEAPGGKFVGSLSLHPDDDLIVLHLDDREYAGQHEVSLTMQTADGTPVAETHVSVEFERSQPNGPGCDPICWFAEVLV